MCENATTFLLYDKTPYIWSNKFTPAKKIYTTACRVGLDIQKVWSKVSKNYVKVQGI